MRGSLRAFFAVLLLVLFPVFVLVLGIGGAVLGFTVGHRQGVYVAILSLGMVAALGFALVQALRSRVVPPDGPRMSRAEQPGLWRMVDELAAQARTRPPDEIILVPEINAAVSEDARGLGLRPGRRYMMIGLPLLAGLSVAELRSVLAHELGHYGGGHTRLLAVTYRGAETLRRTVSRLDSSPVRLILNGYAWLYAVLSRSANRAQELQADAYSVQAVGRETAIAALRRIATMDLVWSAFADRFLPLPVMAGRTPDILLGFRAFLEHPEQRRSVAEIEPRVLDSEPSSLLDSHPPIRRRIAVMAELPDHPVHQDAAFHAAPAWTVLADADRVIPAAEAELYLARELGPRENWAEIVRLAGAADSARGAELLAKAGRDSGTAPGGTLGEILHALGRGAAGQLVAPLLPQGMDQEQARQAIPRVLTELLGDVIVCALLTQGRARHELNWGGPWRVVGPDGELNVAELVAPVVHNPALVPQLGQRLQAMGVPADFVRWPSEQPAAQRADALPQLVAIAPVVSAFRKQWDVFVHDAGLLLIPLKMSTRLAHSLAGAAGQGGHAQLRRIGRLMELDTEERFRLSGTKWIARATIAGGDRKKFRTGGGRITLAFPDGGRVALSTRISESYQELAEFLDAVPGAGRA